MSCRGICLCRRTLYVYHNELDHDRHTVALFGEVRCTVLSIILINTVLLSLSNNDFPRLSSL